jgi:unsaturated rhamnogalacturonyl hydrolase
MFMSFKKNFLLSVFILVLSCMGVKAQPFDKGDSVLVRKIADSIVTNSTFDFIVHGESKGIKNLKNTSIDSSAMIRSPYNEWKYWNGVINIAMLRLSQSFKEDKYRDFVIKNYEFAFDNMPDFKKNYSNQDKWDYPFHQLFITEDLDDCGAEGAGLIEANQIRSRKDFEAYLNVAATHILQKQLRISDATLVRKSPVKFTIWADDLYMSVPFLARMGKWTGQKKYFDDAILQVLNFTKYLYNANNGLYYHCWFSDNKQNGVAHWGRSNGWIMMAQVELLDYLPKDNPMRSKLIKNLQQQIIGVSRYQDASGLWHQLLDKNDSYLETSATAMFVYSIAKAVNNGWIDKRYAQTARAGFEGIKLNISEDGKVKNICKGTGVQNYLGYYYSRPAPLNDIHGIGPVILAFTEVMKLPIDKEE